MYDSKINLRSIFICLYLLSICLFYAPLCKSVTIEEKLPKDVWINIMECLSGNDKALNFLSRTVGVNEIIAQNIASSFILLCNNSSQISEKLFIDDFDFENCSAQCLDSVLTKVLSKYFSTFSFKAYYCEFHAKELIRHCILLNINSKGRVFVNFNTYIVTNVIRSIINKLEKKRGFIDRITRLDDNINSSYIFLNKTDLNRISQVDIQKIKFCEQYLKTLYIQEKSSQSSTKNNLNTEVFYNSRFVCKNFNKYLDHIIIDSSDFQVYDLMRDYGHTFIISLISIVPLILISESDLSGKNLIAAIITLPLFYCLYKKIFTEKEEDYGQGFNIEFKKLKKSTLSIMRQQF